MLKRLSASLTVLCLVAGAGPSLAQSPTTFKTAEEAFLAGMQGCLTRFDGLKTRQAFDDPAAFPGFTPSPESRTAPGVASLVANVANAQILKAGISADGGASVYVVIPRGGSPTCRTLAIKAPDVQQAARKWLENRAAGWVSKGPEMASTDPPARSLLFGRPFQGDIGIAATLMWLTSNDQTSISALSTMSLARER
jgi:hypothetical protein